MAIDDWLLDQVRCDRRLPTFRLFAWAEPTLSLGWHQSPLTLDNSELLQVRRPTGGQAVLHGGDLCYSLVVPQPPNLTARQIYAELCQFLQQAFAHCDLVLTFGRDCPDRDSPDCFARATAADLQLPQGGKCIGSAQRWRDRTLLQQGSIQLQPPANWSAILGTPTPPTLPIALVDLAATLVTTFEACYGVRFEAGAFSLEDWQAIDQRRSQFQIRTGF